MSIDTMLVLISNSLANLRIQIGFNLLRSNKSQARLSVKRNAQPPSPSMLELSQSGIVSSTRLSQRT